jgi:hypothetical protein
MAMWCEYVIRPRARGHVHVDTGPMRMWIHHHMRVDTWPVLVNTHEYTWNTLSILF